jgi:hypothetical protein
MGLMMSPGAYELKADRAGQPWLLIVIPAKPESSFDIEWSWIPAFAGMTS